MTDSKISANIDLEADGKRIGWLNIPHSRNESGWGSIHMPIAVIANGAGPRVLLTGGNHGDEYEGQIALMDLVRGLEPAEIQGRVVVIPHLNYPAVRAGQRLSPIDGGNMNRAFPGHRNGGVTEMIAHYVATAILPGIDAVLDIHSGGRSMYFHPAAIMHRLDDPAMMARTMEAMVAFGAPVGLVLVELDSAGMLDTEVERRGTLFLSTELGGAASASPATVAIARTGVANLLKHLGVLAGEPLRRDPPTRVMETPDGAYVISRDQGIYEALVETGEEVRAGQPVGRIHDYDNPEREPVVYHAALDGLLLVRHMPGLITRGDCLAVIATDWTG